MSKQLSYSEIDRSMRRLKDIETENTLLPESFAGNVERAVQIYDVIRPFLIGLAALPLFPAAWRRGVDMFNQALDAVAAGVKAGGFTNNFKAGKDL